MAASPSTSTLKHIEADLWSAVRELQPLSYLIVHILAAAGKPLTNDKIFELVQAQSRKSFAAEDVQRELRELLERGILHPSGSHSAQCPACLCEDIAISAMRDSSFKKILRSIQGAEPLSWRPSPEQLLRHFRWSLLAEDAKGLRQLEKLHPTTAETSLSAIGRNIQRPESFLEFPPDVSRRMVVATLCASINAPFPAGAALEALKQLVDSNVAVAGERALLAHQLAMRGDRETLDQLLTRFPIPLIEVYRDLLAGELRVPPASAFELGKMMTVKFVLGVAMLALGHGIPNMPVYGERDTEIDQILAWLEQARAQGRLLSNSPVLALFRQATSSPEASCFYRPHLALALHWAGYQQEAVEVGHPDWAHRFRQAGYVVFADWLDRAAGAPPGELFTSPFPDLLKAPERWRDALGLLREWVDTPRREAEARQSEERIVWEIRSFGGLRQVEVKIQRQAKKGGWTPGQRKRVAEVWEYPPGCADEHDRRVFDAVAQVAARHRGLYRAGSQEIEEAALLALAGHPRVYLAETLHLGEVELVRRQPTLITRLRNGSYQLLLEPAPSERGKVVVLKEGPRRIALYEMNDRLIALSKIVGRGIDIPQHYKDELQALITDFGRETNLSVISDLAPNAEGLPEVDPDPTLLIRLTPTRGGVAVQLRVAPLGEDGPLLLPGEGSPILLGRDDQGRPVQTRRDLKGERASLAGLRERAPELIGNDFELPGAEAALNLLESLHPQEPGFSLQWPEGGRLELKTRAGKLSWQRVRASADWFEVDGELTVSEHLVLSLSELLKRRAASGGRFLKLDDGTYLALTRELHRQLARLERYSMSPPQSGQIRLARLAALTALEESEDLEGDAAWQTLKARADSTRGSRARLPEGFSGQLRPYQIEGFRWLSRLASWGAGACLADDMGLGKTVQILVFLLSRAHQGPALVVAPTSVGWNWKEEAARFAPSLKVVLLSESDRQATLDSASAGDLIICSYGLMVREVERLCQVEWSTVVLDEAQAIKNSQTKRAQAALALKAEARIAATGTPVENHLEELWSLFRWLNPGLLGALRWFQSTFPAVDREAQDDLARLIRPFLLRRTKQQVLSDLPARTDIVLRVELSEAELALYESLRREAVQRLEGDPDDYMGVLAELTRLRRCCCHPRLIVPDWRLPASKLQVFRAVTDELMDNGHRALVFSQFVGHLKVLAEDLDERGIAYQYLDGSTPQPERRAAVESFQNGSDPLFLISLKAGGTGLNLTAADYVLHMDPWWNPAVEDQASDRAHRLGQQRPVTVYRMVARGTVEERIVALHENKRDLAERLLEGTDSAAKLTSKELLALLR